MKNVFKYLAALAFGAAAGTGITYVVVTRKLTREMDAEVESIRELYLKGSKAVSKATETKISSEQKSENESFDLENYLDKAIKEKEEKAVGEAEDVTIIPEEEYDINEDYKKESWKVYDDGIVVTDSNYAMSTDDIKRAFGEDIYYELMNVDDCLFVRNHAKGVDYELIKQLRNYNE